MSDIIVEFARRRRCIQNGLRNIVYAREQVDRWPKLAGPRSYLQFVEHGHALNLHRYCGRPKPADLPPPDYARSQAEYIEAVMSIPLPGETK